MASRAYILSVSSKLHIVPTQRQNYLRKKLLKTLTKPYQNPVIPPPPATFPILPVEPVTLVPVEPVKVDEFEVTNYQEKVENGNVGSFLKDEFGKHWFFKLGLYLVGILVFQTVCAVWVFGSDDIVREEGKDLVFEGKSMGKTNLSLNGNRDLDVVSMENKVGVIQAMAREARERERVKLEAEEVDNSGGFRTGVAKEVDNRLVKVQNKLRSGVEKVPVREQDDLVGKDRIEPVMIKKKYKFRGPSGGLSDKPKGFSGTNDYRVGESDNGMLVGIEDERNVADSLDLPSGNYSVRGGTERKQSKERSKQIQTSGKKMGKESMQNISGKEGGNAEPATRMGATQEASLKRPVGSSKTKNNVDNGQIKAGHWWSSLPYVVAVLMGRGHNGEVVPTGLFTLKTNPYTNDDDDLSHLVAFEDRGDATNFCYVLESFFEDLGDFSADIVALSTKDIEEEVNSHSKKVVVVKKGQLKLYAGQPLVEVEMALRSLVQ